MANWNFIQTLGSGAFGEVSLWRNNETGQSVALKICTVDPNKLAPDERDKLKKRWTKESALMTEVDIENIVRAVPELCPDLAAEQSRTVQLPVIVMEYCDGGNLRTKMQLIENLNGLSENDVRQVLRAMAKAISHLHSRYKITHRDIKPENIVIKFGLNGKPIYKLADLGYARQLDCTAVASMVGTRHYFAPEIVDTASYNNSVDFWSLGVVGFEIICGIFPFTPSDTMFDILVSIKQKPPGCIAITMSNDKSKIHHMNLFPENRLSVHFSNLIEAWLQIALETDMHKRGGLEAPDELHGKEPPTFYRKLDVALNAKVLTVYWLNRLTFLSYSISESTTMPSLISQMESDTGVNGSKFYFVIPVGHSCKTFSRQVQPIELHDEKFAFDDKPMLYLVDFQTDCLCKPNDPFISDVIRQIFDLDTDLKPWIRKQCLLNTLFLHHNQLRRVREFVNGIKEFAMSIESDAMKAEEFIKDFQPHLIHWSGQVAHYEMMLAEGETISKQVPTGKESIMEEWNLIAQNLNMYSKIRAVVTRIRTFIEIAPFQRYQEDVVQHVKQFEDVFEYVYPSVRSITTEDIQTHVSSLLRVQKIFIDRSKKWLQAKDSVIEIHNEFEKVKQTVKENQSSLVKLRKMISQRTADYMKNFARAACSGGNLYPTQNIISEAESLIDEVLSFVKCGK